MTTERVADMTLQELRAMIDVAIDNAIDQKLRVWPGQRRDRSVEEVLESMRSNIWTPPPGAKSTLELLREDRDR